MRERARQKRKKNEEVLTLFNDNDAQKNGILLNSKNLSWITVIWLGQNLNFFSSDVSLSYIVSAVTYWICCCNNEKDTFHYQQISTILPLIDKWTPNIMRCRWKENGLTIEGKDMMIMKVQSSFCFILPFKWNLQIFPKMKLKKITW